jgi:hypothetical protein
MRSFQDGILAFIYQWREALEEVAFLASIL